MHNCTDGNTIGMLVSEANFQKAEEQCSAFVLFSRADAVLAPAETFGWFIDTCMFNVGRQKMPTGLMILRELTRVVQD